MMEFEGFAHGVWYKGVDLVRSTMLSARHLTVWNASLSSYHGPKGSVNMT